MMLCSKKQSNRQKNASSNLVFRRENRVYNIPELEQYVYNFIDDTHYDELDSYGPPAVDRPQAAPPAYDDEDLGPNYLHLVADNPDVNPPKVASQPSCDEREPNYIRIVG